MPIVIVPPLRPAWEEGAIAHGGSLLLSPLRAIQIFLHTAVIDDVLPSLAFCALWCTFCRMSRYLLEFYYRLRSSGGSTNDRNEDDEGATAHVLPLPRGDNDAAPPDHLLWSRRCWGGGIATPSL
jgi:hypothetical protein